MEFIMLNRSKNAESVILNKVKVMKNVVLNKKNLLSGIRIVGNKLLFVTFNRNRGFQHNQIHYVDERTYHSELPGVEATVLGTQNINVKLRLR